MKTVEESFLLEKERENSTEKSRFIALLAHELKSPLAAIEFAAENILRSQNLEIAMKSVKHIQSAAREMSAMTERCLCHDKLESTTNSYLTTFSLATVMRDVIQNSTDTARFQIYFSQCISLKSDEVLCRMMLSNLIENALKYSPEKSMIKISAEMREMPTGVLISISNEIGKSGKPDAEKIFQKYYRHPNALKFRGMGLGLWLVRGIAEQLNGTVKYIEHENRVEFQVWITQ